jgi:hypothetical protein
VVGFTLRPLHPLTKISHYPLDRRRGRPQSRFGRCEVEKNPLPLPGNEPRPSSLQPVAIPTELRLFIFRQIMSILYSCPCKSK